MKHFPGHCPKRKNFSMTHFLVYFKLFTKFSVFSVMRGEMSADFTGFPHFHMASSVHALGEERENLVFINDTVKRTFLLITWDLKEKFNVRRIKITLILDGDLETRLAEECGWFLERLSTFSLFHLFHNCVNIFISASIDTRNHDLENSFRCCY